MLARVYGLEAILAAIGGLLLGLGLGVAIAERAAQRRYDALAEAARELETVANPWLRARLVSLESNPPATPPHDSDDPDAALLVETRSLIETVQRIEEEDMIGFGDTVELESPRALVRASRKR